jgi:L-fuculose-phosphate aldolase
VCAERESPMTSSNRRETHHSERLLRADIVEVCRRIYARGWLAATDGNVSVRLGERRILATPTGIHKGYLSPSDIIVVDDKGRKISGHREPSSELRMHIAAYEERADVGAVVHAHPTNCIAFSLAGVSLAQCLLPEIVFMFGSIPTTAYTTPTTEEVPAEVRKWLRDFDAMVLDRHGSLTVGPDVFAAYDKLERMEHVAEITFRARMLGPIRPLTCDQIARLQAVGTGLGLRARRLLESPCDRCSACEGATAAPKAHNLSTPSSEQPRTGDGAHDELVDRVCEQLQKTLGNVSTNR